MTDRKLCLRIGLFLLTALSALAVLLYLFGLFPNLFRPKKGFVYYVEFASAPNVSPNTRVRRSGVKIGEVETVDLKETGRVQIAMRIDPKYPLHRYEEPTLASGLLSGDTSIDLLPREKKTGQPEDR